MALLDNVKIKKAQEKRFAKQLQNWNILQPHLSGMTEDELLAAMLYERQGKNRLNIMQRLYGRFTKLRSERERREVLFGELPVNEKQASANNVETD